LDLEYRRRGKVAKKARNLLEARERKFFLDNIEKKINSNIDEGCKVICVEKINSSFIDFYDSGILLILFLVYNFTLLMNMSDEQHVIVQKLQKKMVEYTGYPLEVELFITLALIHPWLIKTATTCAKFFN
jgi:DNA repair and recombination RAD54-like protein